MGLLDSVGGVPGALDLADVEDLAGVVGVVGADVGDGGGHFGERGFVGCGDEGFEFGEVRVEVVDDAGPGGGVEVVEGLVVVGGSGGDLLAFEAGQDAGVPEPEMVSEHADGVVRDGVELARGVGGDPLGLLGREAGDGGVDEGEPLGLVVRGAELVEEGGAEGGGGLRLFRRLGKGGGGEEQEEKQTADGHVGPHGGCCGRREDEDTQSLI